VKFEKQTEMKSIFHCVQSF